VDLGEAFEAHARRVRDGEPPRSVAGEYLLHNTPGRAREVIAGVLEVRASTGSREEAVRPLLDLCTTPLTIRATTTRAIATGQPRGWRLERIGPWGDDEVAQPKDGDRLNRLRSNYWETLGRGALLLALRGARRCFLCHADISDFRRESFGPLVDCQLRSDYCERCLVHETRGEDEYAIRKLLEEAAPAILA
jgi:hypothetical protein